MCGAGAADDAWLSTMPGGRMTIGRPTLPVEQHLLQLQQRLQLVVLPKIHRLCIGSLRHLRCWLMLQLALPLTLLLPMVKA